MILTSMQELVQEAESRQVSLGRCVLDMEAADREVPVQTVETELERRLEIMFQSVATGFRGERSVGGLLGGQALRYREFLEQGQAISGGAYGKAIAYSLAVAEANAAMGLIVACPTAGSSGIVPGVLMSLKEEFQVEQRLLVEGLAAAGAVGMVAAQRASVSGAQGGCQAECGSAAAMAAVAAVEMLGGSPSMAVEAGAMALKGMLGLVCDPVAGLVEVPCAKRNVAGAVQALAAADMARAGIVSTIPLDEVIDAMGEVGRALPGSLRETARGGLAVTPTGRRLADKIFGR